MTSKIKKQNQHRQPQAGLSANTPASGMGRRLLLVLLAAGIAAGTWAFFEFVVWNRLPAELAGKWVVQGGEQHGATFDFYRNGSMVGRINNRGKLEIVEADVVVEGSTLFITTRHPLTKAELTKQQTIKTLDATRLELQDEQNHVFRMERATD